MNQLQLVAAILLLSCATNHVFSQPGGETAPADPELEETATSFWVDGGIGIASKGFIYRGGAHFMLRPVIFSIGVGQVSGKSGINISGEWERLSTVHAMASFVMTPPGTRVMASIGAGVGYGQYEERALTPGSNWLLDPIYETRKATVIDFPMQLTANFLVRSDLGLFVGFEGHVNSEMPTAGLVVGVRIAPIE
jgi:hypothetical protein